jgi:circadian clock protein KaiC
MSGPGDRPTIPRLETGIANLDAVLHGGMPQGVVTVLAGPPGSGKTILTQQICFHHASQGGRVLYFNTLSQPTAKTLLYLQPFTFFDQALIEDRIRFIDLGLMLRTKGIELTCNLLMDHLKQFKPSMVVIDSFKVFDDLARSSEELRKFTYELSVRLMAWECTTFLLGEYNPDEFEHPAFSAIDGIITVKQRELSGEQQRLIQVIKMRGTSHSRDEHPFIITSDGVEVYAPSITLRRKRHAPEQGSEQPQRMRTGISKLDELLGEGIPLGSSIIVSGVAGSGKTMLALELLYRGAQDHGEKGIFFSFEETPERLLANARAMGWELEREIARERVRIIFIPQPDILVDRHILEMQRHVEAFGARRVVLDSMSVFLHKIADERIVRDKVFWLANIVLNQGAVGFFINDTPPGSTQLTRFGVEETVMDGVLSLKWESEGLERHRYIEVVKLRNTDHARGRHSMSIGRGGLTIYPRLDEITFFPRSEERAAVRPRVSMGEPRLDELLGGGLLEGSVTLVSGSPGTGKSTLGMQFAVEAARHKERALYITLEEGPTQLLQTAEELGLPLQKAIDAGKVEILYLPRAQLQATRFLSLVKDKIQEFKPDRLVLDSASDVEILGLVSQELRLLLYSLVVRLRGLGVTSLFTLEARSLFLADVISERGLSPLADNILMLRYAQEAGSLVPLLTVVKTRGSAHDPSTHRLTMGKGGLRLGSRFEAESPPILEEPKKKRRLSLKRKRSK